MKSITPYTVLKRLVKISESNYGTIENYDDVIDTFSDIPKEKLFKICMHLSTMLYVDYDYCDEDNKTFNGLIILPEGYNCLSNRRLIALNTTLSLVSVAVAVISLLISLTQ